MKIWMIIIVGFFLFIGSAQAADYYRWIDENGVSHITDQPPPKGGKNVQTYRFSKPAETVPPESQTTEQTVKSPESQTESGAGGNNPVDDNPAPNCEQALQKARADYEEAKSHEIEYQRNFNDAYGYGRERKYWRAKLDEIEELRQRVDNLEKTCSGAEPSAPPPENP
jgi:hypothetical protein